MSSARFFAFVEGGRDRAFLDRVIGKALSSPSIPFRVITIKEVDGDTGGKIPLLKLFQQFKRRQMLSTTAFGKSMLCAFFVDKDADDFCRKLIISDHLLYTTTYDIEGHLFNCGDLQRALADACGLTLEQAKQLIPDKALWLANLVSYWKDWTALCLISQRYRINCGCTFDRVSAVNPHVFGAADIEKVNAHKRTLCAAMGSSDLSLKRRFSFAHKSIDLSIATGQPLTFFKGKWLLHAIQQYLQGHELTVGMNLSSIGDKICTAILARVSEHSHCECEILYARRVTELVRML